MDKLVAELMIHANMTWGKLLDEAGLRDANGSRLKAVSRSVTMGYTSGTNDVWCLGGNPAASEENVKGRMKDVRIAQVARDAAWFRQVYQRGRGTWNG
jgi:hypothetical protein